MDGDSSRQDEETSQNDTLGHSFDTTYRPFRGWDLLDSAASPPPMLVADLVRSKGIVAISGEPYCGKTLFLLDLALSLDTGAPFLNTFLAARGHRTLFVGQDAPTWDYVGGYASLARGLGYERLGPMLQSVFVLNRGLTFGASFGRFVESAVATYDINVLMLDTLKAFHDYDENSNQEMARVMDQLKALRDTFGLTVLFSHHTAKPIAAKGEISGNYRARGASVIAGSIDQHIILGQSKGLTTMSMAKARGSDGKMPATAFRITATTPHTLDLDADSSGNPLLAAVLRTLRGSEAVALRSINEALRADASFAPLTDAQLYSRISASLLALERSGVALRASHGVWSLAAPVEAK